MDKVTRYRACVSQLLETYKSRKSFVGDIEVQLIEDTTHDLSDLPETTEGFRQDAEWFMPPRKDTW